MAEGFLEITEINAPTEAKEGDSIQIYLTFTNKGSLDNFKWNAKDQYDNILAPDSEILELSSGDVAYGSFSFLMPRYDVIVTITTYHQEGGVWTSITTTFIRDSEGRIIEIQRIRSETLIPIKLEKFK